MIRPLANFFGSLYFAIFLIAATLLFVIAGTFFESYTESHLFAAAITYENPIFKLLLWLYFVNILFSALNRYPFQKKHLPFLLTHLGLLLLLLGVFVKNHWGVQGSCALTEGSGSSQIYLPRTLALHIENKNGFSLIELKKNKLGELKTGRENLSISLLQWIPHAEERVEGFFKGEWFHIVGHPPFKVGHFGDPPGLTISGYAIYAYHLTQEEQIPSKGRKSLFFIQDSEGKENFIAFNAEGERYEQSINGDVLYVYNKGYGGYGTTVELPPHFPAIELTAPLTRSWSVASMPLKREEATPLIRLLVNSGDQSEIATLHFDQYGQKLKWPLLGGKYLIRFQSMREAIPYHLRLRSAEQINYPGTNKPFSYAANLLIDHEEVALSMNHVFDKKGYRFYLANLITRPSGANQIQIVVNYDPAKYWLTYPGAIILALGILLLYLRKRYITRRNEGFSPPRAD